MQVYNVNEKHLFTSDTFFSGAAASSISVVSSSLFCLVRFFPFDVSESSVFSDLESADDNERRFFLGTLSLVFSSSSSA